MTNIITTLVVAALGSAFAAGAASAAVVCNDEGDCWRVKERYEYRPEFRLQIYKDDWKWGDADSKKYRWREAGKGRGYWNQGVWIQF